jgi:glycosyltransferase involved in cell wall biosynthesis
VSIPVPKDRATRWLYRTATARVVTTGEALREQLVRDNGLDADRVDSVPTGIDAATFTPLSRGLARADLALPATAPIIGVVATLRSWKGHRYLLDAMPLLRHAAARLVIVGDGPQRAALEAQVDRLALRDRVTFAGQQDKVAPWLCALDVFVLPSYANEGVPQALIQAMLVGLPCVTTNIGSMAELAIDRKTALVVQPQNVHALAAALRALLADATLRDKLGAEARRHCAERFGYETMLDRMENIYKEAADAHR